MEPQKRDFSALNVNGYVEQLIRSNGENGEARDALAEFAGKYMKFQKLKDEHTVTLLTSRSETKNGVAPRDPKKFYAGNFALSFSGQKLYIKRESREPDAPSEEWLLKMNKKGEPVSFLVKEHRTRCDLNGRLGRIMTVEFDFKELWGPHPGSRHEVTTSLLLQ